jgi:hypothetical protein
VLQASECVSRQDVKKQAWSLVVVVSVWHGRDEARRSLQHDRVHLWMHRRAFIVLVLLLMLHPLRVSADHLQVPNYQDMEVTQSRTVITNPFSGITLYRVEYRGSLAIAYRMCHEEEEPFPFAIADFAHDTLYLDHNRDGHIDEAIKSANLTKRNLVDDLPSCLPESLSP